MIVNSYCNTPGHVFQFSQLALPGKKKIMLRSRRFSKQFDSPLFANCRIGNFLIIGQNVKFSVTKA